MIFSCPDQRIADRRVIGIRRLQSFKIGDKLGHQARAGAKRGKNDGFSQAVTDGAALPGKRACLRFYRRRGLRAAGPAPEPVRPPCSPAVSATAKQTTPEPV